MQKQLHIRAGVRWKQHGLKERVIGKKTKQKPGPKYLTLAEQQKVASAKALVIAAVKAREGELKAANAWRQAQKNTHHWAIQLVRDDTVTEEAASALVATLLKSISPELIAEATLVVEELMQTRTAA